MYKLAWTEGTLLSQQHFQCWDRYLKEQHHNSLKIHNKDYWGIHDIQIDQTLLKHGIYKIQSCHVIYPSGIHIQSNDVNHSDLIIDLTQEKNEVVEIYMCIPIAEKINDLPGYPKVALQNCRWRMSYKSEHDRYDESRIREIAYLHPNIILKTEPFEKETYQSIKIDELQKDTQREIYHKGHYIPSVTNLCGCRYLMTQLEDIIQLTQLKINELKTRCKSFSIGSSILNNSQWMNYLSLRALQKYFFILSALMQENAHPKEVFHELIGIAGELVNTADGIDCLNLPMYQHDNLTTIFETIICIIRERLEQVVRNEVLELKMFQESISLYSVEYNEKLLDSSLQFYLVVQNADQPTSWMQSFLYQIKITSRKEIYRVIDSAIPALPVKHVERPPSQLPIKDGVEYFQLKTSGLHWKSIITDQSMMIFIPNHFASAKISLVALEKNTL